MKNAKDATEAQIEEVDWSVGEILDALREEKLAEKTLVLFTSAMGERAGV
jgi:arylsulfatase A-like enzyme